jgi:hypothetical protein
MYAMANATAIQRERIRLEEAKARLWDKVGTDIPDHEVIKALEIYSLIEARAHRRIIALGGRP